jgi:hypothetical protein
MCPIMAMRSSTLSVSAGSEHLDARRAYGLRTRDGLLLIAGVAFGVVVERL